MISININQVVDLADVMRCGLCFIVRSSVLRLAAFTLDQISGHFQKQSYDLNETYFLGLDSHVIVDQTPY